MHMQPALRPCAVVVPVFKMLSQVTVVDVLVHVMLVGVVFLVVVLVLVVVLAHVAITAAGLGGVG